MNNTISTQPKLGFQSINFDDLEKFNPRLELDEIVLMQYLIHHCNTNQGNCYHSSADVELSVKVKKHRLKTILDGFERQGWVSIKKGGSKNRRCFQINFEHVCSLDFLTRYYDYSKLTESEQDYVAGVFIDYLKNYRSSYSKLLKSIMYPAANETYENLLISIEREFSLLKSVN
jgi:hypothetical protein